MAEPLAFGELEGAFEAIAEAIDEVGPEREAVFLAKLALTLSHRLGTIDAVHEAIAIAKADLEE